MRRFNTKRIHLATHNRKPVYYNYKIPEKISGITTITVFLTACGAEVLRKDIRMRTNEVTCRRCTASHRYKAQFTLDNNR